MNSRTTALRSALLVFLAVSAGCSKSRSSAPRIDAEPPALDGKVHPTGEKIALSDYKGKVVLIDFWATWCGPCVGEMPNVQKLYQDFHGKGLEIIGISLDRDADALDRFVKEKKIPWPQIMDATDNGMKIATAYGVESIPNTFLLDKNGLVVSKGLRGPELYQTVAGMLDPKK